MYFMNDSVPFATHVLWCCIIFSALQQIAESSWTKATEIERPYRGRLIGKLKQIGKGELQNQAPAFRISGTLYAADDQLLYIHDFLYDAGVPGLHLWAISSDQRTRKENMFTIALTKECPRPTCTELPAIWEENLLLALPRHVTFDSITEFALGTRKNDTMYSTIQEKYASVLVPTGFKYPRPVIMPTRLGHTVIAGGVSSRQIIVQDSRRIFIEQVTFDGSAPGAYFWVDPSPVPTPSGFMVSPNNDETPPAPLLRLPKEPLTKYDALLDLRKAYRPGKTGNVHYLTVFDVKSVAIYDRTYGTVFGDAPLEGSALKGKVPPALDDLTVHRISDKALTLLRDLSYDVGIDNGIQVQPLVRNGATKSNIQLAAAASGEILMDDDPKAAKTVPGQENPVDELSRNHTWNCEILDDTLNVQWKVQSGYITITLSAPFSALPDAESSYLAFGLSGSNKAVQMVGSDITLGFVSPTGVQLRDFVLGGKITCNVSDPSLNAVCPRNLIGGKQISRLVGGGGISDGIFKFSYRRPLETSDVFGKNIPLDAPVYIVWSIGPVATATGLPGYHSIHATGNSILHFGRSPENNCDVSNNRGDNTASTPPPLPTNLTLLNIP